LKGEKKKRGKGGKCRFLPTHCDELLDGLVCFLCATSIACEGANRDFYNESTIWERYCVNTVTSNPLHHHDFLFSSFSVYKAKQQQKNQKQQKNGNPIQRCDRQIARAGAPLQTLAVATQFAQQSVI
jgi:hypothetical protein